jgi:hemerythrin HHE cation binding domain-containing protein
VQQAAEGCISGQAPSGARVRYTIVTELTSTLLRNHLFVKMRPGAQTRVLLSPPPSCLRQLSRDTTQPQPCQLEEQIFYPTVNEETDDGPEMVKDSLDEHETMKNLIQELRDMGSDHKAFDTKFKKLIQNVEHHVEEEENEMFPLAEEELEEDMAKLKEEMQELKQEIMAS